MEKDPFKEYLLEKEPSKKELAYSWYTAIGLQKVDGLSTSDYLKNVAIENINGNISFDKAEELIKTYYIQNSIHHSDTEEADKVAVNIAKVLSEKSFVFSPGQYLDIHKKIFSGVFPHAGKIRDYNIVKKEWVLDGDTVIYGGASLLKETLEYDFACERDVDYSRFSKDEFVSHIARFISNLWQIHVFFEGNTRATAIFLIKYLRKFGYDVTNDTFAKNAWYFRNALVRANYSNVEKGVFETTKFIEMFLYNLLYNENNELKNRYLHIRWNKQVNILKEKVDIDIEKVDIGYEKVDIEMLEASNTIKKNIVVLYNNLNELYYFGRSEIMKVLNYSPSGASKLISKLLELNVIIPVSNHGKGKYVFNVHVMNC